MVDGSQQAVALAVWVKGNLFWVSVVIQSGIFMVAGHFLLPLLNMHLGKVKSVSGRILSFCFIFNLLLVLSSICLMKMIVFVLTTTTPWEGVIMIILAFCAITLLALWQASSRIKVQIKK